MDSDANFLKISSILENVKSNITVINHLKQHFKILLSDNIIFSNKYDDIMDKLKFLNSESNIQLKSIEIIERIYLLSEIDDKLIMIDHNEYKNKIRTLETNLNVVSDEIIKIVQEYGYISICELMNIIDKQYYNLIKSNLLTEINLLEKFFQPTKIKKINGLFEETESLRIKNIPMKIDKKQPILSKTEKILNKFDVEHDNLKINLIYELNKAQIEIETNKTMYIIEGYFREDVFNEIYQTNIYEQKYKNIKKKLLFFNPIIFINYTN